MKLQQITWVVLRVYGLWELGSAANEVATGTLIHAGLMHSQVYESASYAWYALLNVVIGVALLTKTKLINDFIYSGFPQGTDKATSPSQGTSRIPEDVEAT